ncbi:MAG TPA: hypothetical protein DCF91_09845 [Porphyromonadaceae bacterium]|nr:hypothetical protein [Porphyromonadaceae bacterium]
MLPLNKDLQQPKKTLDEFYNIAKRVKEYMPNVLSHSVDKNDYTISVSDMAGTKKYIRPINKTLYINNNDEFHSAYILLKETLFKIKIGETKFTDREKFNINSFLYTIQQSIGAGLDLLVDPNSSRKHVGNRFEELIRVIFDEIGIANKRVVLRIPYASEEGEKIYKCENDLILSSTEKVNSTSEYLDDKEIVVSVKTTSKDRMGKMFIDKILLERFVKHPQKVIGIFNNDVQRKENSDISFTLVSGLFMVYTQFLTQIEGVYYLDPPPTALKSPFNKYMKRFSELITNDVFVLFNS